LLKLAVFSYKVCWRSANSPTGYATDGGFAFQMRELSMLFEATTIVTPVSIKARPAGEIPLTGNNVSVVPLQDPEGSGLRRKLCLLPWLAANGRRIVRETLRADAIHTPVPADLGTFGMLAAYLLRKPLLVRYCGNWLRPKTAAERFWRWFMESVAGGRNVMLATGGSDEPPSRRNPNVRWIFSSSLTETELAGLHRTRRIGQNGRIRLITVCRQEKGKNTEVTIAALAQLRREHPNLALDIVGDGSEIPALRAAAAALGLSDRVIFHGKVDHAAVLGLLRRADLFCYPTSSEGFPKAVLEALACGLPVISTPVSVIPQLVGPGCGVLISQVTPEAVADAVRFCLADAERFERMSASTREQALAYSLERWRATIGELLARSWGGAAFA
jgi:glycosyltransferase involved in cell wall biosynthesis